VADPKQLSFPAGGSTGQVDSGIIDQFRSAITDLTSQVDDAKASADQAQQAAQNAAQSAANVKASADGAYIFGMIGVGVGVAGIVLAVIALSRKEKVEGKVPRF
jgi:phosphotransferase system  glucose/maltose/N-acetylglucosamine-specific IIC component